MNDIAPVGTRKIVRDWDHQHERWVFNVREQTPSTGKLGKLGKHYWRKLNEDVYLEERKAQRFLDRLEARDRSKNMGMAG